MEGRREGEEGKEWGWGGERGRGERGRRMEGEGKPYCNKW